MEYKYKLCPSGHYVSDEDCDYCNQCRDTRSNIIDYNERKEVSNYEE